MLFSRVLTLAIVSVSLDVSAEPPDWFQENLDRLAPGDSIWTADNSAYQSDSELFDTYVMEWNWGIGRKSAVGRLDGMIDGKDVRTLWEFRMYWHSGDQSAYVQQFGADGTFGTGTLTPDGDNKDRLEQIFFSPAGNLREVGHVTEHHASSNVGTSYDILPDGSWQERRSYVWQRKPKGN